MAEDTEIVYRSKTKLGSMRVVLEKSEQGYTSRLIVREEGVGQSTLFGDAENTGSIDYIMKEWQDASKATVLQQAKDHLASRYGLHVDFN